MGQRLAAAHSLTLARLRAEKYFLRRTCRRRKWLKLYLRLRAQTLRGFFDGLCRAGPVCPPCVFRSSAGTPLQSEGKRAILYKEYYVIKGGFPLSFCDKCGAYIPIGETECPACGYDPEAEAKKAAEAAQRAAEEERRRAAEQARREREEAARRAQEEAQQKAREEAERRYAEQQKRWQQDPWQQTHTGGPAQGQYTSQRTAGAAQAQYTSQRTGSAQPNAQNAGQQRTYSPADETMRRQAAESVERQKLSVFSYLGPFWLIPAITQKDDPFMKYHTEQGLGLIIFGILTSLLGNLWGWVGTVGGIICTIGAIKGIVSVLKGKREPLPVIGDLVQSVKESIAKRKNKR